MPALLAALNGAADIPLTGMLTVVGRHPGCDSRLDSSRVSRRHCCLAVGDVEVVVRDLGSTNGTWVNDRRVEDGVLRPGDVLGIAHLRFRLILLGPARFGIPIDTPRGPEPDPVALSVEAALETAHYDQQPSVDAGPIPGSSTGR